MGLKRRRQLKLAFGRFGEIGDGFVRRKIGF